MNVVNFPGLGLSFKFSKIAFTIFGIEIYKYSICIILGIIVALIFASISKEKFNLDFNFVIESVIIAILFGIIGARIYYVLFNLDYYTKNIGEILNFRNGGLAIYGGLIFGSLSILIYCKLCNKDALNLFDFLVPFVAIAQFFGRFGNFFNLEAYGYETKNLLRMEILVENRYIEVHPMFLYEAIINLMIFVFLRIMQKRRKFKGEILLLYLICYSSFRMILERYRADSLMFYNVRISQILSTVILIISLSVLILKRRKINNKEKIKNN